MPRQYAALLKMVSGALFVGIGLIGQGSSVLTPFLAAHPVLLRGFGYGGIIALVGSCLLCLLLSLRTPGPTALYLAALYAGLALVAYATVWGRAFQLGLAGLTVGLGLLSWGAATWRPLIPSAHAHS